MKLCKKCGGARFSVKHRKSGDIFICADCAMMDARARRKRERKKKTLVALPALTKCRRVPSRLRTDDRYIKFLLGPGMEWPKEMIDLKRGLLVIKRIMLNL